jgi:hypothetical protein
MAAAMAGISQRGRARPSGDGVCAGGSVMDFVLLCVDHWSSVPPPISRPVASKCNATLGRGVAPASPRSARATPGSDPASSAGY